MPPTRNKFPITEEEENVREIFEGPPYERFKDYTMEDLRACDKHLPNAFSVRMMARSEMSYRKPHNFFQWLWWELTAPNA